MRVVIVDDHPLILSGLTAVFASEDDIEVVGQAATVEEAIRVICEQKPDIGLVDLKLREASGLSVIHECKPLVPDCRYVVLTSSASRSDFTSAMHEGVDGYALKE